jgi:hypothetical protein
MGLGNGSASIVGRNVLHEHGHHKVKLILGKVSEAPGPEARRFAMNLH